MDALHALTLSTGLVTGLAASTVLLLRSSFLRLLVDLCRSEIHGKFWLVFATVAIVLTSLFGSLMMFPAGLPGLWSESNSLDVVVTSFRAGLLGLLLSLASVAFVLLVSMGQRQVDPRAPDPRAGGPGIGGGT